MISSEYLCGSRVREMYKLYILSKYRTHAYDLEQKIVFKHFN